MNNFDVPFEVCIYCGGVVTVIALVAMVCLWSGGIPEKVFPRFDNIFQVYLMRGFHFYFLAYHGNQLDLQNVDNNFLWYSVTLETYLEMSRLQLHIITIKCIFEVYEHP